MRTRTASLPARTVALATTGLVLVAGVLFTMQSVRAHDGPGAHDGKAQSHGHHGPQGQAGHAGHGGPRAGGPSGHGAMHARHGEMQARHGAMAERHAAMHGPTGQPGQPGAPQTPPAVK